MRMTKRMHLDDHMTIILMIILLLLAAVLSSEGGRIAMPNCTESCGNINIPYPFGIGPDESCYFNKWFEVDCLNGTQPFLRLTNLTNLEVLSISVNQSTLRVHSPVISFCNGNASSQAANLTGSPFVYSQLYNKFTAVSCHSLAVVLSSDGYVVTGCWSICGRQSSVTATSSPAKEGCDIGVNCCQTTIPPDLTVIDVDIINERNQSDCKDYAFLVDKDWFDHNTTFSAVKSMPSVPVVLEWSLINDNNSSFLRFLGNSSSRPYYDPTPFCVISDSTISEYNQTTISCYCPNGFEGNPYLLQDCDDIDECKYNQYSCWPGSMCVNIPGSYECYDHKRTKVKWILGGLAIGVGLLLLLIGAWLGYRLIQKRNDIKCKEMFFKRNGGLLLEQQLSSGEVNVDKIKLFKSKELEKSTDNFNNDRILGHGGQGTVYKGMLSDGRIVAVKKSKKVDESKLSEFINEVVILSQISHRNVVKILGCCLETEVPLLVYEFIPNGTLSQYIQGKIEEFPLTWEMRVRIATEVAGALSYLHSAASFPIYHRDIKSTNILLDEKYRAKVADFGTSRSIAIDQTHLTTLVHGTFGYLDPEYLQSSQFTDKSDVYSFGVILVELLTGQKPISFTRSEQEGRSLATYFIISMQEDRLFEVVDDQVAKEGSKADIAVVANLARRCLNLNGRKRPTMREVTAELEGIQMSEKASNVEVQNYEEAELVRTESIESWDVVSSSAGTGSSVFDSGSAPSFHEIPLLSFKSW